MTRRQARETALKVLFQVDLGKVPWQSALSHMVEMDGLEGHDLEFLKTLVTGTVSNLEDIDAVISKRAVDWKLDRMLSTDRNILRLATFELLHSDVPPGVTVNEAVELAKAYGDENSGRFVNGILGNVVRQERRPADPEG